MWAAETSFSDSQFVSPDKSQRFRKMDDNEQINKTSLQRLLPQKYGASEDEMVDTAFLEGRMVGWSDGHNKNTCRTVLGGMAWHLEFRILRSNWDVGNHQPVWVIQLSQAVATTTASPRAVWAKCRALNASQHARIGF